MMITGSILVVGAVVVAMVVGGRRVSAPGSPPARVPAIQTPQARASHALSAEPAFPLVIAEVAPKPVLPATATAPSSVVAAQPGTRSTPAPAPKKQKEIQDPVAREALALVGADPEAEAYWYDAINDPSLPAHERQDLIEDLNEDGLSNPSRPGPKDLPLIVSRLFLIEEVAADAMDKVNADAFQEAYKDLSNMYLRLTQP